MRKCPKSIITCCLCLMLLKLGAQSDFHTIESVPDPKLMGGGYVSDPDVYLSALEVVKLNNLIKETEENTTAQIAVVLLKSIGNENPKDFATRLFAHWGIGYADTDNGLLILSVMDQRRTEFETGYGMEAVLTDVQCYRIGMQELVPYFKQEQYGQGLIAAVSRIKTILENPEAAADIRSDRQSRAAHRGSNGIIPGLPLGLEIYFLINLLFHLILATRVFYILRSKQDLYDKYMSIRKWKLLVFIFIFPLLYLVAYFLLKGLLKQLRNHPRYSKANGQLMRKLKESEEDYYLSQGQITEEEIGSVDYDVWVTEEEDDILILRYKKPFTKYSPCPKCRFTTYFHARSVTIRAATYHSSGKKEEKYECKNCSYQYSKYITIPMKTRSSSGSGGGGGGGSWGGGSSGGGGAGVSW